MATRSGSLCLRIGLLQWITDLNGWNGSGEWEQEDASRPMGRRLRGR